MRNEYMAGQFVQVSQADFAGIGLDGDMYNIVDGVATRKTQVERDAIWAVREQAWADALADSQDEVTRLVDIISAQKTEGLKKYTIQQAAAYLQTKLSTADIEAAADLGELKAAIVADRLKLYQVFIKIIPYLMD